MCLWKGASVNRLPMTSEVALTSRDGNSSWYRSVEVVKVQGGFRESITRGVLTGGKSNISSH